MDPLAEAGGFFEPVIRLYESVCYNGYGAVNWVAGNEEP